MNDERRCRMEVPMGDKPMNAMRQSEGQWGRWRVNWPCMMNWYDFESFEAGVGPEMGGCCCIVCIAVHNGWRVGTLSMIWRDPDGDFCLGIDPDNIPGCQWVTVLLYY